MTDLDMKPDPFLQSGIEIPPSELPYKEDNEPLTLINKSKLQCFKFLRKVPLLSKVTGSLQYRRDHRCQSTRSRLRSLNENRRPKSNYPRRSLVNKRVHKVSEMSIIEEEFERARKCSMKEPPLRSISSEAKSVQFEIDFSAKSFNEDTDFEFTI